MQDLITPPTRRLGATARFGPENVLRALQSCKTGEVISLNLPLDDPHAPLGRKIFDRTVRLHHHVRDIGDGRYLVLNDEEVSLSLQSSSQWTALAHLGLIEPASTTVYHGGAGLEETAEAFAPHLGIQAMGPAMVTRGVLLDFVALLDPDRGHLAGDVVIDRATVERCIDRQSVAVEPGDAVMIYTGFQRRRATMAGEFPSDTAGIDGSTVALWEELQIQCLVGDTHAIEATPPHYAIHLGVLRGLGIPMGELFALDSLALACRRDSRHDFLLAGVPLNIPGAFGSTANAVAIR